MILAKQEMGGRTALGGSTEGKTEPLAWLGPVVATTSQEVSTVRAMCPWNTGTGACFQLMSSQSLSLPETVLESTNAGLQ